MHQTTQNAIEASRSHLNGLDGEIVAYDQKIENRGTEMLFLQGYMRKQNGIKKYDRLVAYKQCGDVILYIIYDGVIRKSQETEKK